MKLAKILVSEGMARSGSEALRLIQQGSVSVGGCKESCEFFTIGKCSCGGWEKKINPTEEITSGMAVKVGSGHWRLMNRIQGAGWDQVRGVGRVP